MVLIKNNHSFTVEKKIHIIKNTQYWLEGWRERKVRLLKGGMTYLAVSPASGELTAFSCCYGYLQQVAEWGWFRHQQRIREAEFRQGPDSAESHSTAETDKRGDAQEGRWASHTDANTNNLFYSSCADKVRRVTNPKDTFPLFPVKTTFPVPCFLCTQVIQREMHCHCSFFLQLER